MLMPSGSNVFSMRHFLYPAVQVKVAFSRPGRTLFLLPVNHFNQLDTPNQILAPECASMGVDERQLAQMKKKRAQSLPPDRETRNLSTVNRKGKERR